MELKVSKTQFPEGFKEHVKIARFKGVSALLDEIKEYIGISCYMNNRAVGRFLFKIDGEKCVMTSRLIIESEFYPQEIAIMELLLYCKRHKIKVIQYNI